MILPSVGQVVKDQNPKPFPNILGYALGAVAMGSSEAMDLPEQGAS